EPIELENGQSWPDTLMLDVYNLDSSHTVDVGIIDPVNETYYNGFGPGDLSLISQPSTEKTTIVQWTSTFLRDLPEWARAIQLEIRLVGSGTSPPMGVHRVWMTDNEAPEVIGISADPGWTIYRTKWVQFSVEVEDDLERTDELLSQMFYKKPGSTDWETDGLTKVGVDGSIITWNLSIPYNAEVGEWELMVNVTDTLDASTGDHVFTEKLMVMNNIPTAPAIEISPVSPGTEDDITVSVITPGVDVETGTQALKYSYEWYHNGKLHTTVNTSELSSQIPAELTRKGDTWMVKVYTVDDLDRSDFDTANVLVINTAPYRNGSWGPLHFDEDTPVGPIDLNDIFYDLDDDDIQFNAVMDDWLTYEISDDMLTIEPGYNWNGEFTVNITATDGELHNFMVIDFVVDPVNDLPVFDPVEDMTATEDEWFNYTFNAWDSADLEDVVITTNITDEVPGLIEGENYWFDGDNSTLWLLPDNDMVGVYHLNITFTDEYGGYIWTNVILTIENVNDAPTGVIMLPTSKNVTINKGDNVSFMASGEDVDGDEITFYWVQKSGTSEVTLGEGEEMTYTFTIPGVYNVVCLASDGKTEASIGKVTVNVLDPTPPNSEPHDIVLDASINVGGLDQETAAEVLALWESTRSVRADIPLILTATAIDDDGDELTFTWSHDKSDVWGMSGSTVTINPNELTPDTYVFMVTIDDGAGHEVTRALETITILWAPGPQVDDDDDDGLSVASIVITVFVVLFWLLVVAVVIVWLMLRKKKERELAEKEGVAETGITLPPGPPKEGGVTAGAVSPQPEVQPQTQQPPAPAPKEPAQPPTEPSTQEPTPEEQGPVASEAPADVPVPEPEPESVEPPMQEPPAPEENLPPEPPPAPEAPPIPESPASTEPPQPPAPPEEAGEQT
ncbi:MAG: PKD domain-containing protein, partial [Thermoplasmatota archaeon]